MADPKQINQQNMLPPNTNQIPSPGGLTMDLSAFGVPNNPVPAPGKAPISMNMQSVPASTMSLDTLGQTTPVVPQQTIPMQVISQPIPNQISQPIAQPITPVENQNPQFTAPTLSLDKLQFGGNTAPINNPVLSPNAGLSISSQPTGPVGESILSKINKENQGIVKKSDLDLKNIDTSKYDYKDNTVKLGDLGYSVAPQQKKEIDYLKILVASSVVIFLSGFLSFIFFFYNKYLELYRQPLSDITYSSYMQTVSKYENMLSSYIKIDNIAGYAGTSFLSSNALGVFNSVIGASDLNYVHKKDIIQTNLTSISQDVVSTYKKIEDAKQNISEHGFYPLEIADVLLTGEQITSIKRSIMSLETTKFLSAIKVFSYLDTFLDGLADYMTIPKVTIKDTMDILNKRGEEDVNAYLNNCYLNPFETDYTCATIGDFDFYYKVIKGSTNADEAKFDTNFFKKMMYYIDAKLEQTALPSFSIVFQGFDPTQQVITFNIDVNTFQQDETALLKQGILNPHIFIVTNLLNLLRQSTFVVGNSIDVKNLKIKQKNVMVGTTEFVVNNSFMTFTLPIQKFTEREITDFTDN